MNQKEHLRDYPLGRLGLGGNGQVKSHADMMADIRQDQMANEQGLQCPAELDCNAQCKPYIETMTNLPRSQDVMRQLFN